MNREELDIIRDIVENSYKNNEEDCDIIKVDIKDDE